MIQKHVTELLGWVGLADHLETRPPTLSGGQQQRVAIARAVIARPRLLLADEPTGNVDDRIAIRLLYLFEELNRMGTTVVIATHNEYLVNRFQHPQLHLEGGRLDTRPPHRQLYGTTSRRAAWTIDNRLVPWIVGVMAYLAALALSAALTLSNAAREWGDGLADHQCASTGCGDRRITDDRREDCSRCPRIAETDGVDSARPILPAEIGKMLEPWLEASRQQQIAIATGHRRSAQADATIDFTALAERLENAAPGSSLETHEKWRNTVLQLFQSIEAVAIVVILLISAVALAAIVLTTRSVLAVHHEIVELLHLIGAQDTYIAEQFQKHAFLLVSRAVLAEPHARSRH